MNDTTTIKCPPLSKPPKFQTPLPVSTKPWGKSTAKHFAIACGIAVHELGPRGLELRKHPSHGIQLLLHNGCGPGAGNMQSTMTREVAIELALELITLARSP